MASDFTVTIEDAITCEPGETLRMEADRVPSKGERFKIDGQYLYVHSVEWTAKTDPFGGSALTAEADVLLTPHAWRLPR